MQERIRRPDARGERTRQRILEAAIEEVAAHPLADVQLQNIAQRLGMSPGHILYHFGSKDVILFEALKMNEARIAKVRASELHDIDDPVERLQRWVRLYLPRGPMDPGWILWLEFWFRSGIRAAGPESKPESFVSWLTDLDEIFDDGSARGVFALPADRVGFVRRTHSLLVGLSMGVLATWQSVDDAVAMAMEYFGSELGCSFPALST
jgi:AcrR family transcriptional regulator